MRDEERELVEEIRNCIIKTREEPWGFMAEAVLSVVKANLSKIAEVCPECNGDGEFPKLLSNDGGFGGGVISNPCKTCNGTGIVLKGK